MARELAITIYLFVFWAIFHIAKLFPQKKKTTLVASFGDNILWTIKELEKQTDDTIIVLKTSQCKIDFNNSSANVIKFEPLHMIKWVRSVFHLATSHIVIVDNYYGFLAVTAFRDNVLCIQVWHAAGAVKKFGLMDPSIQNRSQRAYKRFRKVYNRFDKVTVGSERMATIFRQAFELPNERILRTGIPRTDFFFSQMEKTKAKQLMEQEFPVVKKKKVILYAPTYRENGLNVSSIELDIDKMYKELSDTFVLFLRLHPAVNENFQSKYPNFIVNVSDYPDINHLLVIADILISDYSSIPFEFSLLNKPMIFFAYDLDEYTKTSGVWEKYEELIPGPIVKTTNELINTISSEDFNMNHISTFAKQWNQYSKGNSSIRLINTVYTDSDHYKVVDQI